MGNVKVSGLDITPLQERVVESTGIYNHVSLATRLSPFSLLEVCEVRAWERGYNPNQTYSNSNIIKNNVPTSVHCINCTLCAYFCNVENHICGLLA